MFRKRVSRVFVVVFLRFRRVFRTLTPVENLIRIASR